MFIFLQNFLKPNFVSLEFCCPSFINLFICKYNILFFKFSFSFKNLFYFFIWLTANKKKKIDKTEFTLKSSSNIIDNYRFRFDIFDKFNRTSFPFLRFFLFLYRFFSLTFSVLLFSKSYNRVEYFFNSSLSLLLLV